MVHRLRESSPDDLCVSSVVVAELRYGADRSDHPRRNHSRLDDFLEEMACRNFDSRAAVVYGRLRVSLESRGQQIGPYDMMIAAHALSLDLTLVTDNVREFGRVQGLRIENWRDALPPAG